MGGRVDRVPFSGRAMGTPAFQGRWDLGGTLKKGDACSGREEHTGPVRYRSSLSVLLGWAWGLES